MNNNSTWKTIFWNNKTSFVKIIRRPQPWIQSKVKIQLKCYTHNLKENKTKLLTN